MKRIFSSYIFPTCFLLFFSALPAAGSTTAVHETAFTFQEGETLKIDWRGKPLLRGDFISAIGPNPILKTETAQHEVIGEWQVNNIWQIKNPQQQVTYRREAATNGREVELTAEFQVPAYYVFPDKKQNSYSFTIPLKTLEGMSFRIGSPKKGRGTAGRIASTMPEGLLGGSTVSFIAFEGEKNKGLIFDFRPTGVTSFNSYGPSVLQGLWKIMKEGDLLRFSFTGRAATQNGAFASKIRILEGSFEDYWKLHPYDSYHYYSTIPSLHSLSFGAGQPGQNWQAVGKKLYTSQQGYGWLQTEGINLLGDSTKGVLQGSARGSGTHRLLLDVPQPGIYIVTARVAAGSTAVGPFSLTCNTADVAKDIEVAPEEVKTVTFSTYSLDKKIELQWSGNWALSSLAVQTLIYQTEDFSFKRGVWLAPDLPAPTTLHQFSPAMPPTRASIESTRHRGHPGEEAVHNASLPAPKSIHGGDTPGMDWRWFGNIGSLGPGNYGTFHEFETDEKIIRRLDELQARGYQVLILNGLHFRTAWREQQERVQKTIARIVELAHERKMKIVEHRSSTVIPNQATAYNQMLESLGQTLREVHTGQITRGYCLNNPTFRESLMSELVSWVKQTKSDGLMLDELSFHTKEFCGCVHCRERFHKDTGVWLPTDETDPTFFDKKNRLWVLWLKWRNQALGDWSVELITRIREELPDFVLMKYSTHYSAVSNFVTLGQGGGLHEDARSSNFIGTEIMSRNVYATHRPNLAYRSIFNSLREHFDIPVFGLVYPNDQPLFAYVGWVMNNMRAQSTWSIIGADKVDNKASSYIDWKENMDIRKARPLSEVAVIFSSDSRDFARYQNHSSDLVGTCEQLDDLHIPYDVLLSDSLTLERLAKYKALILPSVCAMRDTHIQTVKEYLEKGGAVLALGHTATLDETGSDRVSWPIGEWLGLRWTGSLLKGPLTLTGEALGTSHLSFSPPVIEVVANNTADETRILAEARSRHSTSIAIAEREIGKGKLVFAAPRLGAANYEPEVRTGQKLNYQYNAAPAKLFASLVRRVQPERPRFEPILIPREVRTSLYEQQENGQRIKFLHLFNATGASVPSGRPIPRTPPKDPFPKLSSDLIFDITLEGAGPVAVDLVSPDFPSARPVQLSELGDRRYRVTVAKDDLEIYSIVRLRSEVKETP